MSGLRLPEGASHDIMSVVDGSLVRDVCPRHGQPYAHYCSLAVFKEVCHTIDERDGRTFTGEDLARLTDQPSTQVFTALAFLKDRGIVETARGRKNVAATIFDVYLDAMIEWHASEDGHANV